MYVCTCICINASVFICLCTLRVKKYGNEGPKNSFLEMAYNEIRKVCYCFFMEVIADVTNTN